MPPSAISTDSPVTENGVISIEEAFNATLLLRGTRIRINLFVVLNQPGTDSP